MQKAQWSREFCQILLVNATNPITDFHLCAGFLFLIHPAIHEHPTSYFSVPESCTFSGVMDSLIIHGVLHCHISSITRF